MSRSRSALASLSTVVLLTAALACSDTLGVNTGSVEVTIQQSGSVSLAQLVDGPRLSAEAAMMSIDPANVSSLTVVVTSIEFLPVVDEEAGEEASWIPLDLPEAIVLDLLALPTEGESPLVIAAGDVEPGDYENVRLRIGDASIVFEQPFTVGQAEFDGEHAVTVPSGAQTGLKTDLAFSVVADGEGNPEELNLLFDPSVTFLNATATGNGAVILAPVLKAANE